MTALLNNQAFDAALVALIVAIAGYIQMRTRTASQATAIDGLQKNQAQQGSGGAPTTVVAVAPPSVGAGRAVLAAPVWNQLNDVLPDGLQDPYATTDCGEESVAMAIAACGGPSLPAGVLRQLLGGPTRPGMTSAADLHYLFGLFKIKSHVRLASADAAWIEWQHSYGAGFLVIALGYWVSPGFRHWVLIRETDGGALTFNDPWGGEVRVMTREEAQRAYCGEYVHIDQAVSAPAAGPPS